MRQVLFCIALFSGAAIGQIVDPCLSTGQVYFTPAFPVQVPGPNTVIGYLVATPPVGGPSDKILVKREDSGGNVFTVDVVITSDPSRFPDYRLVMPRDHNWDFVGPLPPGSYSFVTTVVTVDPVTGNRTPACPARFPPTVTSLLTVSAVDYLPATAPVIEFYNLALDDYFITQDAAEIRDLDTGVHTGWVRTGQSFAAFVFPAEGIETAVIRFYGLPSAGLNTHFFTLDVPEQQLLANNSAWIRESPLAAFGMLQPLTATGYCPPNTVPVYRLWNNRANGGHRYTSDPATKAAMISQGYVAEGYGPDIVYMCSPN